MPSSKKSVKSVECLKEGGYLLVDSALQLSGDITLPDAAVLVFEAYGSISGSGTLHGNNTRIIANPYAHIFGAGVKLSGSWQADFSPLWFGAVYDGKSDCTAAIQACLDRRGRIHLRGCGTALISKSLFIHGQTWLQLDPGFTITLAPDSCCPMLRTKWSDQRYFAEQFPDFVRSEKFPNFVAKDDSAEKWQLGEPERNIKISGGTWDGNGGENPRLDYLWGSFAHLGYLISIVNVDGFELSDTKLYDAGTYFCDLALVRRFELRNIHVNMRQTRPNQDGIHLEGGCYDGVISHIHGRTWDDMVALNGGDSFYPKYPPGVEVPERGSGTNILWTWTRQGMIRNITIRDIKVSESMLGYRAVRLLSTEKYKMDNILIDGIYGNYHVDGIIISSHYEKISPYGTIVVRNILCTVDGNPIDGEGFGRGFFTIENSAVQIDTLIVDGGRYQRTANNGQFLCNRGAIKRLYLNNLELDINSEASQGKAGILHCHGDQAYVGEAFISNFRAKGSDGTRFKQIFSGEWRKVHLSNAAIEND